MRGGAAAPPARRFAYCTTGSGRFLDQLPTLPASLHHRVTLPHRQIDAAAVDLTRPLDVVELLAAAPAELEVSLGTRPQELSLAWNTSSS